MLNKLKNFCAFFMLVFAVASADAQYVSTPDSFLTARPVIFRVNRTEILIPDSTWIADTLATNLISVGEGGYIVGRAAASPEGPIWNNKRLATGRRKSAIDYLLTHGFDASQIQFDAVTEDYELLISMMEDANDPDVVKVRTLFEMYPHDEAPLKRALKLIDGGKLWERLLNQYFPSLRAVRILISKRTQPIPFQMNMEPLQAQFIPAPIESPVIPSSPEPQEPHYRREILSVKTNLLMLGCYMPVNHYGWCPMPNVEVEYYPKHGHYTFGFTYDIPWWIGSTSNHKYFEMENTTLYGRYYFRNGDILIRRPGHGAAFSGWYLSMYGHYFRYEIGFSNTKGWVGEAGGGGFGGGYVLPLTHRGHWRLDFGAQVGYFHSKFDPFVFGTPVERIEDGLYYYKYYGHPKDFKIRQHGFNWFGPTRIGVSLSYDLFYRKQVKGISLRSMEKE